MKEISTTYELFMHDLKAIYYLEGRLEDNLSRLAGETSNEDLSELLREHQTETANQIQRLEDVFDLLNEEVESHASSDFEGHLEEIEHMNERITEAEMFDISALNSAIKTEQMEITTYKGLLRMVDQLAIDEDIKDKLRENLNEEEKALDKLQRLAGESWLQQVIANFRS